MTPKTKVLLLNSPHNPTGKVFSLAELQAIAEVVRENPQLIVISDEVYKYTIYDAQETGDGTGSPVGHHHFARLPGEPLSSGKMNMIYTLFSCSRHFTCVFAYIIYLPVMYTYRHVGPYVDGLERGENIFGDGLAGRVDDRARKVCRPRAAAAPVCTVLHTYTDARSTVDGSVASRCTV